MILSINDSLILFRFIFKTLKKFILILFIFISLSFKINDNCGKYRWYVKTLTDAQGSTLLNQPSHPTSIHALVNEYRTAPHFERDPSVRYDDEKKVVKVEVILLAIKAEEDNDFHIVLKSTNSDETLVGEVPYGDCSTFDNHLNLRNHFNTLRRQIVNEIGFYPTKKLKYVNRKIILEGVPFWDEMSNGHKPTGSSPNQREVHPILKMEFK